MSKTTVSMKRIEMIQFVNSLYALKGKYDQKFTYFIFRNKALLKDEYDSMRVAEQSAQPTERYEDFQKKRYELYMLHGLKGPDGGPLQNKETGEYLFGSQESINLFNDEMQKLAGEYSDDIVMYDTAISQIHELKQEETDVEVFQVPYEVFPIKELEPSMTEMLLTYFTSDVDELEQKLFGSES